MKNKNTPSVKAQLSKLDKPTLASGILNFGKKKDMIEFIANNCSPLQQSEIIKNERF